MVEIGSDGFSLSMFIDTEKGDFRSGCVGGGRSTTGFRRALSGLVVGCIFDLGAAARATCSSELADTVGLCRILRLGRAGGSSLTSPPLALESDLASRTHCGALDPLLSFVNGLEIVLLFRTCSTLSFSNCSSTLFIVLAVLEAIRDCWIKGEIEGLGFNGGGVGVGGGSIDPCFDSDGRDNEEALERGFRGGSGGSFDDPASGRYDNDLVRVTKGLFCLFESER